MNLNLQRAAIRLAELLAICLVTGISQAASIDRVVVFGDSLSDNGNLAAMTSGAIPPSPPFFPGRTTNGLVWAEVLAVDIGAQLSDFAIAGATTGASNVFGPYGGLQNQVANYTGGAVDSAALHIVWAGSNNFLSIPADIGAAVAAGVNDIVTALVNLRAGGAAEIMVINLPDLGLTPRLADAGLGLQGSVLTDAFNVALLGAISGAGLTDIQLFDSAGFLRAAVADPAAFGFTNVTQSCLAQGCISDLQIDPDDFLFFDDIHPTRAAHALLADEIRAALAVPAPATLLLFSTGLGFWAWLVKRCSVFARKI